MLRVAIPYGTFLVAQMRTARPYRAPLRQGLRPFHHAPKHSIQLALGWPRCPTCWRIWRGRDARRSRPAATAFATSPPITTPASRAEEIEDPRDLCRNHPPVVDASSRVLVPAAQVQDRGDRRRRTTARAVRVHDIGLHDAPRRAPARSASRCIVGGGGLGRTPGHRQERSANFVCPSGTCCPIWKRSCGSTTSSAGATISSRRASRFWFTSTGAKTFADMVDRRMAKPSGGANWIYLADAEISAYRGLISRRRPIEASATPSIQASYETETQGALIATSRSWARVECGGAQAAGLRHRRNISLKPVKARPAGRCHCRANGCVIADLAEDFQHSTKSALPISRT